MALDPILPDMAAAAVAIVLLTGAWHKLRDPAAFRAAVDDYALLPAALAAPFARLLPVLELGAGLGLVIAPARASGAALALVVLGLATLGVAINLLRGRTGLGCGCGGIEDEQPLSWALVARNGALAALISVALADAAARPLAWLDYLTVGAGAVCLYCVYIVFNQLVANAPRLARLRHGA
jgi:hypothetical protein